MVILSNNFDIFNKWNVYYVNEICKDPHSQLYRSKSLLSKRPQSTSMLKLCEDINFIHSVPCSDLFNLENFEKFKILTYQKLNEKER